MIYDEVIKAEKKLDDCIDWETGEIDDNYELAKQELESILSEGIETLCKIRANKQARIESLKAEINRLTERKKQEERRIDSLENYIKMLFDKSKQEKLEAGTFNLSYRKSTQVKISDDFYNKEYIRVKEEIDKAKIKIDLLAGVEIKGAYLVENKNLQIK